jgi:hypothetical protein
VERRLAKRPRVPASGSWGPITLLGRSVAPGERQRFPFSLKDSFVRHYLDTTVVVVRGTRPGPTLCVTGGIHGDELNGMEIARRVHSSMRPEALSGTLIAVPAVNMFGFRTGSRYLMDRRDLNRFFPGKKKGSLATRLAYILFHRVVKHAEVLIDLHTGSNLRTNMPQIRVDLDDPKALALARAFGAGVILGGRGPEGSLRRAASDAGITAVIYEAGEPLRLEIPVIEAGVEGVLDAMGHLGMIERPRRQEQEASSFQRTLWVRVPEGIGGVYLSDRRPGQQVRKGESLGEVIDPVAEKRHELTAPATGQIIGMAVPQIVVPGFATFHIGTNETGGES